MLRPTAASGAWYTDPATIDRWYCGVFEGGGAKGVAYTGALVAMRELRCWFSAVAGASAGAITAALVAAGLTPEDLEGETDRALKQVRSGVWKGIRRLHDTAGYFPSEALVTWLNALLLKRVGRAGEVDPLKSVTFRELFSATGIELNVVAADLSLQRQIVFSHHETPECGVAEAVAASSAIPFAFASRLLAVREPAIGLAHHTIVDGGVWANFPTFIFDDRAFRTLYKRTPVDIAADEILGFLLDEGQANPVTAGAEVQFARQRGDMGVCAREWFSSGGSGAPRPTPMSSKIVALVLWPFALLGRLVELNGRVERGRWPTPRSPVVRNLMHAMNGLMSGIFPLLLGAFGIFVVGLGAWEITTQLIGEQWRVWPSTDWSDVMEWFVRPVSALLATLLVLIAILTTFAMALGTVANFFLLRASRQLIYGLASTYVSGSGAPEWATLRPNVVPLPIPATVGTLSFDLTASERHVVIASAREATLTRVAALMASSVKAAVPDDSRAPRIDG